MEVVTATPSSGGVAPPFHDHDVREWSTLDGFGVLERARIETDRWAANTDTSFHNYGKVVDSRARTDADGALRQQARRQLEVFQSRVPGGQLQVIKTQSVSSSRWTNKRLEETNGCGGGGVSEFEGLIVPSNPLDLSFQKSKALIARSTAKRPPSRVKTKDLSPPRSSLFDHHQTASANLQKVSRLCHQIHEKAVKEAFGKPTNLSNGKENDKKRLVNGSTNLCRTKSSSSEDFLLNDKSTKSIEDLEDLEHLQSWRRSSKLRRSFQYPKQEKVEKPSKPIEIESTVSVRKITEDFEKGRRLSAALRGNNLDLQALDQILQSISSNSSDKTSSLSDEEPEPPKTKRNSFVTVESIQEIKGRLRRTSSPDKEADDGIVTEEPKMLETNRVKSYVFGMESVLKKAIPGTGSLESRSKLLNGTGNRSEDWYNRRKSYGFEPVQNQNESMSKKTVVESSTDSGICRSSEVIVVPTVIKNSDDLATRLSNVNLNSETNQGKVKKITSIFDTPTSSNWSSPGITIKIPIVSNDRWKDDVIKRHSIAVDETKYVENKNMENQENDFSPFKKSKKVEFCKTEVHFAAESGKVNIVETDEKPPPTQNFRRRRRNNLNYLNDFNKNGLPVLHFGESYFDSKTVEDTNSSDNESSTESKGVVTVNSDFSSISLIEDEKRDLENENIRGILKNKLVKPKPYHLGDNPLDSNFFGDENLGMHFQRPEKDIPVWKSTVTISNTLFGNGASNNQPDLIKDQMKKFNEHRGFKWDEDKPFLSVAERIRSMEENQRNDGYKGYSTRVNIGDGQAIVVESNTSNKQMYVEPVKKDTRDVRVSGNLEAVSHPTEPVRVKAELKNRKYSPIVLRKHAAVIKTADLKTANGSGKLSSPSLVGKNETKTATKEVPAKIENLIKEPKFSDTTFFGIEPTTDETKNTKNAYPEREEESPVYENIKPTREFDSDILEELTKAADEILKAVKDYSEEAARKNRPEEEIETKTELTTINENKSWKQQGKAHKPINRPCKSTNATVEAAMASPKPSQRYTSSTKSSADKIKTKTSSSESSGLKATTKARRLQRASSREALLQSHGSSSEDLAVTETPVRKPRLVRKTKTTQLTMTNGMEIVNKTNDKRKTENGRTKNEERLPSALPEIRHKTAVSTIRSTAEKALRDKTKTRGEDMRKTTVYKDFSKSSTPSACVAKSKRETVTHRLATANIKKYRPDKR